MGQNKKIKLKTEGVIFVMLMTFFIILCIFNIIFFTELDIPRNGFLNINVLKEIGFYDDDYYKYEGYWYPNGHLHPLYVASTTLFRKNYIIDCIFAIVVLIYCGIGYYDNNEIKFKVSILIFTIIFFVFDFVGFLISFYYCLVSNFIFPTLSTFIIYLLRIIFFTLMVTFELKNLKKD